MKYVGMLIVIYITSVFVSEIVFAFSDKIFSKLSFREILTYIKNSFIYTAAITAKYMFFDAPLSLIFLIYGTVVLFLSTMENLIRFVSDKMVWLLRNIAFYIEKIDGFFKKRLEKYFDITYDLVYNYKKQNE